jgi:hypothetical protein
VEGSPASGQGGDGDDDPLDDVDQLRRLGLPDGDFLALPMPAGQLAPPAIESLLNQERFSGSLRTTKSDLERATA